MKRHQLSPFILVMFITGAIDSIRNLPSMALFGQHILLFYGIAVIGFLIPTALITAELSLQTPQRAGIFAWCNDHLNPKAGQMAIWLQWVNTLVWFPSILAFIANTAAYLIDPQLATHPEFTIGCMLGLYWLLTLINCFGVKVSAQFTSVCTVLGMLLPMSLLIGLGVAWWWQHPHLSVTSEHWLPTASWRQLPWSSLTAGITACLGMELIAVYTPQLKQPRQILPKTLMCSTALITVTTLLGVMAIALIIPGEQLNLIAGTLQTFKILLQQNHLSDALPVVIATIALGTTGSMMNWMLSPAEGLQQASRDGLLPAWLDTTNRFDAPHRVLVLQATLVSLISMAFLWLPNFNSAYWLLTDLSTELYLIMYLMLFIVAFKLAHRNTWLSHRSIKILATAGCLTAALCLLAGFVAPPQIHAGSALRYALWILGGLLLMTAPAWVLMRLYPKKS